MNQKENQRKLHKYGNSVKKKKRKKIPVTFKAKSVTSFPKVFASLNFSGRILRIQQNRKKSYLFTYLYVYPFIYTYTPIPFKPIHSVGKWRETKKEKGGGASGDGPGE